MAHLLQCGFMRIVDFDVAEQAEIISGIDATQVSAQISAQRFITAGSFCQGIGIFRIGEQFDGTVCHYWVFRRQRASLLVRRSQVASHDFAGFNIRLVEGVDTDNCASYGSCNFPAEKFLTQIVDIIECNPYYRLPSLLESCNG